MYIIIITLIIIFLICIVPLKIVMNYEFYSKDYDINNEDTKKEFKIYILRIIKIKTVKTGKMGKTNKKSKGNNNIYNIFSFFKKYISLKKEEKLVTKKEISKLKNNLKFQKLNLQIGFNTKDMIQNAYIMTILNYYINSIIAKNINLFNIKDIKYNTYISEKLLSIKLYCIVNLNLVNTILIVIRLIFKSRKGGKEYGKETSNRKLNVDSYDFS